MTVASANIFPKVTLVEGSAPASPAATNFSLYFDSSDHLLKWKNSAGTVTTVATGTGSTSGMSYIQFHPAVSDPVATTGTWAIYRADDGSGSNTYPFPWGTDSYKGFGYFNSTTAQNDAVSWDFYIDGGTYTVAIWVRESTNTGIITLNVDGVSAGTMDTYAAAAAYAKVSLTGVTLAAGKRTIQLKVATKNASSSGYILEIFQVVIRRTA